MPIYTTGSTRVAIEQQDLNTGLGNGSVVLDSRRVRPFWFDGRFLDARDLEREQNYFLIRQADLGQAGGFEVMHGLMVDQTDANGQPVGPRAVVIHAGEGVTPAGEMVTIPADLTVQLSDLPEQPDLDVRFGIGTTLQLPQWRTGLYVIAIQPVEYTAHPGLSYPTTIQGSRGTHDTDIVEATTVSLLPYPNPPSNVAPSLQQAALARQIFVAGTPSALPDAVLPLALVSLEQGIVRWLDPYLVRRDIGPQFSGARFGLNDPGAQQAYLQQFDMQLQSVVTARQAGGLKANFAASDYFLALPSAGRFPIDGIDTGAFSQVFFPQEMDVRLSIIPSDQLPALFDDSMSLPPIDLTLPSNAYSDLAVFAFIPVSPDNFAALKGSLPDTPLNPILPQVLANRSPIQLLRLFQGAITITPVPAVSNTAWAMAIGSQKFGFYLRRRSDPTLVTFLAPTGVTLVGSPNPSVLGQAVTFTATISPSSATGKVDFSSPPSVGKGPTIDLGTGNVSGGMATISTTSLTAGTHDIIASYEGDAHDAVGNSAPWVQTVTLPPATVTLKSSVNPSTVGQSVTFTATVTPASATGSVQFMGGTISLGTGTLSSGAATLPVLNLTVGSHSIKTVYGGDASNGGNTSNVLTQIVNLTTSIITLNSSLNPSTFQQSVTFTAQVSGFKPTGSVQFLDGTTSLGTVPLNASGAAAIPVASLTVGPHTIHAVYSGDANNTSATIALTQTVNKIASSVSVVSSLNPSTFGTGVTFTATVSPALGTGTVQFLEGATALGTSTVTGGKASFATSSLTVGTHPITAVYSGDTNTASSQSAVLQQSVTTVASSVALASKPNPSVFGQTVNFTATVTPSSATGNVQFLDGTTSIANGILSGGTAIAAVSTLAVGTHSITAAYAGDANTAASTSNVVSQAVTKAASTVALVSSQNPSVVGSPVTFTATVTPSSATGTVQFLEGTTVLGSATLASGSATLTVSSLAVGTHSLTASYSGDGNNAAGTSNTVNQVVNKITSSVALVSSQNPSPFGTQVTFKATITPAAATGTVQFLDGATVLGTGTISTGVATFATATLAVGTHSITAVYSGDANDTNSTSNVLTQTVTKESTNVALASSPNPSTVGASVTFTATVTPASATGTVQFMEGATVLGSTSLAGGSAKLTVSTLAVGTHSITASYNGDGNNAAGNSNTVSQVVDKLTSSVALASSLNPSPFGTQVIFKATIPPATATGTVQFLDGTAVLGTGPVSAGSASFATSTLAVGAHSITAVYGGDANDANSTSSAVIQNVTKESSNVVLASAPNPSTVGASVTFTATVTPASATGTVQFLEGSTVLGTATLAGGSAKLALSNLAVGTHSVTASYGGDGNNAAGNSNTVSQVVNRITSSVALASSLNPSTFQAPVTFRATVTPASATGTVQFLDGTTVLGSSPVNSGVATFAIGSLAAGTHSITAVYSGDTNDTASTSNAVTQTVNKLATTVTVSGSPNPTTVGSPVNFTAIVAPKSATGTMEFRDGATVLGSSTLNGGVATFSTSTLAVGSHSITAVYSGDANDAGSTSPAFNETITLIGTTVALVSSANPATPTQAVTFTATVAPSTASGAVAFSVDGKAIGSVPLSGGAAKINAGSLAAGAHPVTGNYPGDATHSGSSGSLTQNVNKSPSTMRLVSSNSQPTQGSAITLTATVSPATATGTVQFQDTLPTGAITSLGAAPLKNGVATLVVGTSPVLPIGVQTITAIYGGDANTAAPANATTQISVLGVIQ